MARKPTGNLSGIGALKGVPAEASKQQQQQPRAAAIPLGRPGPSAPAGEPKEKAVERVVQRMPDKFFFIQGEKKGYYGKFTKRFTGIFNEAYDEFTNYKNKQYQLLAE